MRLRFWLLPLALALAACAESATGSGAGKGDRCLYAVEAEYGRLLRWDSCAHPPPYAVRIGGPD